MAESVDGMKEIEAEARAYVRLFSVRFSSGDETIEFRHLVAMLAVIDELRAESADLQRTFDLMWTADQRAIKLWQEANPGNDMVWPDRSKLTGWLLAEIEKGKK